MAKEDARQELLSITTRLGMEGHFCNFDMAVGRGELCLPLSPSSVLEGHFLEQDFTYFPFSETSVLD